MTGKPANNPQRLTELRAKIDAVDESIHNLLMQRASVIDELIKVKGSATQTGAAFRPGREASMMSILAERHSGSIPMEMIIHIWRDIISTFTYLQAPYSVHLNDVGDANLLRDMARFQFGFTVPVENHPTPKTQLEAVAQNGNALAVIATHGQGCWWQHIGSAQGLGIITRLPVFQSESPSCDAFVIAPPIVDPVPFEWRTYSGTVKTLDDLADWTGGEIIAIEKNDSGDHEALIAIPEGGTSPKSLLDIRSVGGYFAPVRKPA